MATPATGYVTISRRSLDLEDYIDITRRHVSWIMGPTLFGTVVAVVVAFVLPNTYISTAVMRITPSQISANIVPTTLNQQLTERIMTMQQDILSRTSLSNIIQDPRLDLYKSDRANRPLEDVIETMRTRDIAIRIIELPGSVLERRGASAFNISFSYPDAHKAQQVVQTMMTKFTEVNLTSQREQQSVVTSFVHDQLLEARANLDRLNEELTKFKVANAGKLPEQSSLNIAQLSALQQQLATASAALERLDQTKVQLDAHLDTLKQQMEIYKMFDKEPDLASATISRQNDRLAMLNKQVTDTESSLAQMHQVYKSTYPDIRDAENRLQVVRKERDDLLQKELEQSDKAAALPKDTNPKKKATLQQAQSFSALQGQIDATMAQAKSLEMERNSRMRDEEQLKKQMIAYQERLTATSVIEGKYAELIIGQKASSDKVQVLEGKENLTEQNGQLLQRKAGENLEVLDPPSLPEKPAKPNRLLVVGSGAAISFILGLAMAGVQEARDTSLKNLKDVRAYTNLPVLSSIPLLENTMLVRRQRRLSYLAWSAGIIVGMLCVSGAMYYYYTKVVTS